MPAPPVTHGDEQAPDHFFQTPVKNDLNSGLLLAKVTLNRVKQRAKTDPEKRALAFINRHRFLPYFGNQSPDTEYFPLALNRAVLRAFPFL
jgi:hypothetical protein